MTLRASLSGIARLRASLASVTAPAIHTSVPCAAPPGHDPARPWVCIQGRGGRVLLPALDVLQDVDGGNSCDEVSE